jgi:hypothetical protein
MSDRALLPGVFEEDDGRCSNNTEDGVSIVDSLYEKKKGCLSSESNTYASIMSKSRYYMYARNMRMCASPYTCTCKQPKEAHTVRNCKLVKARWDPAQPCYACTAHALECGACTSNVGPSPTQRCRDGTRENRRRASGLAPPTHRATGSQTRTGPTRRHGFDSE